MHVTWPDIALRLFLSVVAGALIGLNRDINGKPAGMRTTILVAMAATLAMLQADMLLGTSGRAFRRWSPVMARARSFLPCTRVTMLTGTAMTYCTWPPITSDMAAPAPL